MANKKYSTKLYLKISILVFLFFILNFVFSILILNIIAFTPLKHLLGNSFAFSTIMVFASAYLGSTLVASIICYYIIKRVLYPLVELSDKSMKVAKGDFSVVINEKSSLPELKKTLESFNVMVQELNKVEILGKDFINNVSHEFKTPLSVIRSNINIIENTDLNNEERKHCFELINSAIEKLSNLVSNVLKISKLDNNKINIEEKTFRLDEQIRQCIVSHADKIEEKDIELDINLEETNITTDEDLLSQVWENLIGNAVKFTPKKGKITVSLVKEKTVIKVLVSDNGCGINQEALKHIFDRFYQADTSHTKDGNGLGLAIVGRIIKLLNGNIEVDSKINEGTNFVVILPMKNK